jgi:hypothetical protein
LEGALPSSPPPQAAIPRLSRTTRRARRRVMRLGLPLCNDR